MDKFHSLVCSPIGKVVDQIERESILPDFSLPRCCGHKWVSPALWLRLHGRIYFDCKSIVIIKCRLTDWVSRARESAGMFRNCVRGLSRELWPARCVVPRVNVSDNLVCVCACSIFRFIHLFCPCAVRAALSLTHKQLSFCSWRMR